MILRDRAPSLWLCQHHRNHTAGIVHTHTSANGRSVLNVTEWYLGTMHLACGCANTTKTTRLVSSIHISQWTVRPECHRMVPGDEAPSIHTSRSGPDRPPSEPEGPDQTTTVWTARPGPDPRTELEGLGIRIWSASGPHPVRIWSAESLSFLIFVFS